MRIFKRKPKREQEPGPAALSSTPIASRPSLTTEDDRVPVSFPDDSGVWAYELEDVPSYLETPKGEAVASSLVKNGTAGFTGLEVGKTYAVLGVVDGSPRYQLIPEASPVTVAPVLELEPDESRSPITASYQLRESDAGHAVEVSTQTPTTIKVPAAADVDLGIGTTIEIVQLGEGEVTIAPAHDDVILRAPGDRLVLSEQFSVARLRKNAGNSFIVSGDLRAAEETHA